MLVIDEGESIVNSNTFTALQDSISGDTLELRRIQTHGFSTIFINYSKRLVIVNQQLKNP